MSDDMALGFFDADGSVLLEATRRNYKTRSKNASEAEKERVSRKSLSFRVSYDLGQSLSKEDAVEKFAEKFGTYFSVNRSTAYCKMNRSKPAGKVMRALLRKNEPKHPYRLLDFYISEEMIPLLKKKSKSREEILTLARLVSNKSCLANKGESEAYFETLCTHIDATEAEIKQGSQIADEMLSKIEEKLQAQRQTLPTMTISNDYALGAHFGDGSLSISLTWRPTPNEKHRLRCGPEWSISGYNADYCQAFATTFDGAVRPVNDRGQQKFALCGLRKCLSVVSLFENAPWMPSYKQEQFNRWRESLYLIDAQEHFREEGIIRLVDLNFGLAEKGSRRYTREEYLAWGFAWVNDPNRQKRAPRGRKSNPT
jgi:hypothetical protein